jgi:hypothetical protein
MFRNLTKLGEVMNMKKALMCICILFLVSAGSFADPPTTMLLDRGLPTINLNNAAGANRSNVAWADWEASVNPTEYWVPGDDFTISQPGTYKIRTIRVWIVGPVDNPHKKTHLTLWGGTVSSGISSLSTDYSVTPVFYADGTSYQGSSGGFTPINQVDFNVNLNLRGGETLSFFVDGPWAAYAGPPAGYVNQFLHASNRKLSGYIPPQGADADDWFLYLHNLGGIMASIDTWNSQTGAGTECAPDSPCPGWDKPSDANVQVFGSLLDHGNGQQRHHRGGD